MAHEPTIAVGLMSGVEELHFHLNDTFETSEGTSCGPGAYRATVSSGRITVSDHTGRPCVAAHELRLQPGAPGTSTFTLRGITIGLDFHWQRQEDQQFHGNLRLKLDAHGRLIVINDTAIEAYLTSVIASEMSATSHPELLKAHAIISRSWLLAQLPPWKGARATTPPAPPDSGQQRLRWYDRESHTDFDV